MTVDAQVADRQRMTDLWRDLQDLPSRQREALVLREIHGLRYRELASVLDISPQAAKQAAMEARRSLAQIAEGRDQGCSRSAPRSRRVPGTFFAAATCAHTCAAASPAAPTLGASSRAAVMPRRVIGPRSPERRAPAPSARRCSARAPPASA